MKKFAVVALATLSLMSCMSYGTKFDTAQVDKLVVGKTTYAQALQTFGQPQSDSRSANGDRSVMYMYSDAQIRAETFIPLVGGLIGGTDMNTRTLTLQFDKASILKDYNVSTGAAGMNQNLSTR